jgi:hypothetical protein|tara:strand:+ start:2361 stop:2540 length:180 start_codon:yes stop_codon:yes gene_type:complete
MEKKIASSHDEVYDICLSCDNHVLSDSNPNMRIKCSIAACKCDIESFGICPKGYWEISR